MKTIIFDFDGTIANTLFDLADSVNYALKKLSLPERTLDEILSFVSEGIGKLMYLAVGEGYQNVSLAVEYFLDYYNKNCIVKTVPYNNITNILRNLKIKGYRLGVISNKKEEILLKIADKLFPDMFEFVYGEKEGYEKKPSDSLLIRFCDEFNENIKNITYVGDSDIDYIFTQKCRIPFVGVGWGYRGYDFLKNIGAKTVITTPEEILTLF